MKKLMMAGIITFLILPGGIRAEEGQKEVIALEEVVVTATKTEQKRKDIPSTIILIGEMDIEESPATSLGDLLANELGIDWRTYGNYGGASEEIHIRGMSGNATQVFLNGMSINSPSLGTADVARIPLNNIERVEVVKGSGSLLYGTGAMGGTVNIITKRPERDITDLRVSAGCGSEESYQLSAENGMFVSGDLGYYLTANRRETDGFRDNSDLTHNDVSLKVILEKGDALDISLYGDYIDREYGIPGVKPPEGTQDFFVNGVKLYNSDAANLLNNGSDEDAHMVLEAKSQPVNWLGLRVRGDFTTMENYFYLRWYDSWTGTLPGSKAWVTNEVLGAEGNAELSFFEGASLLLGAEYRDYDWEREGVDLDGTGSEISGTRSTAEASVHTKGAYAEAQYRPTIYFNVLAGVRHENHSTFGYEDIPRLGMVLNPSEKTALKLSHGKHFRAPTPNDLFWPEGPFEKGNPDLKPETGWHTDVTIEQGLLDEKLFVTFSYFNWDVDDKILWEPDTRGVWAPQNLRSYKADGFEIGTTIGPFFNLTLALNYTYLDAKEESREYTKQDYITPEFQYTWVTRRATFTPEHQFKGALTYWTDLGLTATVVARYVSDRVWYRTESIVYPYTKTVTYTLDSYWITDMKLEQRLYDHWLLSLKGNNLFKKGYYTYLGTFTDQNTSRTTVEGYPGAGRSIFFSLAYEY